MTDAEPPRTRVRITHPRTDAARRGPLRPAAREIDEQTEVGEIYMALAASAASGGWRLVACAAVAVAARRHRAVGAVAPRFGAWRLFGLPVPWLVLGARRLPGADRARLVRGAPGRAQRARVHRTGPPAVSARARRRASRSRPWSWPPRPRSMGLRRARTTGDFYVASRAVTPRWNAAAIGGEYLSAASYLGIAGLDAGLRLRHAVVPGLLHRRLPGAARPGGAPLRRSGAYTLPDFAQIRLGSAAVAPRRPSCWWCSSAGCTSCRSCRAPR